MTTLSNDILPGPCPTDEEIAALLDAALSPRERARITSHLADCDSCYELLAGAIHLLSELAEATPDRPASQVIGAPRSWPKAPGRSRAWWTAAAAAAALALATAFPFYRWFQTPPHLSIADLVAPLAPTPQLAHRLHDPHIVRGAPGGVALLSSRASFLVGVFEVDLRLSLAAGDIERSSRAFFSIGDLLLTVSFMGKQGAAYQAESERLISAGVLRRVASEAPARETELEGKSSSLLPTWLDFGKWTEAARLAAATRTPTFFKTSANRRFLSFLVRGRVVPVDPEVHGALRKIESLCDLGRFAPADFAALETELAQVIARIETLLPEDALRPIE